MIIIVIVIPYLSVLGVGEVELGGSLHKVLGPHNATLLNDLVEPLDHLGVEDDEEEGRDNPGEHFRQDDVDHPGVLAHHVLLVHHAHELPTLGARVWSLFSATDTDVSIVNNIAEN